MSAKKGGSKQLEQPPATFSLLPKIINGGIAGIIGVSVVFPLDLVKTRMQNQVIGADGKSQYKNMLDCFRKTIAREGYFGMYRGSAINILLITPEKAIKLAANDMFRFYLTLKDGTLPIFRQMVAGGLAGACQIVITTPMELLKIQMQDAGRVAAQAKSDGRIIKRLTARTMTRRLITERGIFGLYRGITATAARDVTFSVIYFPMFATLVEIGSEHEAGMETPFWLSFVSGFVSASTAALSVTPLDVVKTRLQTITKGTNEPQYSSIRDCVVFMNGCLMSNLFGNVIADQGTSDGVGLDWCRALSRLLQHLRAKQILNNEGITSFFKGGACRMIVMAPLFGIAQTVYYFGIAERLLGL